MPMAAKKLQQTCNKIAGILDHGQVSAMSYRRGCVALYRIHNELSRTKLETNRGRIEFVGEQLFFTVLVDMINRILVVRKGSMPADRVIKFLGLYVRFIIDKSSSHRSDSEEDPEGAQTRLVTRLLTHLIGGFQARDKTVRYRAVSIVSELISNMTELDEDLFDMLRDKLIERVQDKEAIVRAYALTALSHLLSSEALEEPEEPSILGTMIDSMCYDPSPEVRRFVMLNIPVTHITLPQILTRTRDIEISIRITLYAVILSPRRVSNARSARTSPHNLSHLSHPRHLAIAQRERVVSDGLGDREDKVRAAAAKMLNAWFSQVAEETKVPEGESRGMASLVAFLKLFDVVGEDGSQVAVDALTSIFITRPRTLGSITLNDAFWKTLTPERVLLARVYIEHASTSEYAERRLESASLPVVSAFAFYTQEACSTVFDTIENLLNLRMAATDVDHNPEVAELNALLVDRIFVFSELLKVIAKLDYTDEIGRRKMVQVIQSVLSDDLLPKRLIDPCINILEQTASSEEECVRIVIDIIDKLPGNEHENTSSNMSSGGHTRSDQTVIRSLDLSIAILKRIDGTSDEIPDLEKIVSHLIIPALGRTEPGFRERALLALGLSCLLSKDMAINSFQLFLNQAQGSPENLKCKVVQIIFDILMVHEEQILCRSKEIKERIITFLLQTFEVEESDVVQALLCTGISKLMLNGIVTDERVLTSLVLAYVSPATSDNQELRQCLAYFLPVYCYSSFANQGRMRSIFLVAYDLVSTAYEEIQEEDEMISPSQFATLFADWTHPQKTAILPGTVQKDIHVDLAVDLLKAVYSKRRDGQDKQIFCQLLGQLYFPTNTDVTSLCCIDKLLNNIEGTIPNAGPITHKLIRRFKSLFNKQFSKQIDKVTQNELQQHDEYREICYLIGTECAGEDISNVRHLDVDLSLQTKESELSTELDESHIFVGRLGPRHALPLTPNLSLPRETGPKENSEEDGYSSGPVAVSPESKRSTKRVRSPTSIGPNSPLRKRKDGRDASRRGGQLSVAGLFADSTNCRNPRQAQQQQE